MKTRISVQPAGFWRSLPRPFFVMAPMANVTDCVFRKLFAKYGKPDVTWTEFVSADGLISAGGTRLLIDLKFSSAERPIVAQLFTGHPPAMKKAAAIAATLRFDGIDINMGCPDRSVEKQGGGAALIKEPKLALAVIAAAREGAPKLPVSVKTRLGYNKIDPEWIRTLLSIRPALPALTLHLRTRKEMSDVPAHWELMPEFVKMRDEIQSDLSANERTLLIGNGDVESLADGAAKIARSSCDGVMIGRGIFGKPWLFEKKPHERTSAERLAIMVEHAKLFDKEFCGGARRASGKGGTKPTKRIKNFAIMRKHFKAYVSGWDGAKELRAELMEAQDSREVDKIVKKYLGK